MSRVDPENRAVGRSPSAPVATRPRRDQPAVDPQIRTPCARTSGSASWRVSWASAAACGADRPRQSWPPDTRRASRSGLGGRNRGWSRSRTRAPDNQDQRPRPVPGAHSASRHALVNEVEEQLALLQEPPPPGEEPVPPTVAVDLEVIGESVSIVNWRSPPCLEATTLSFIPPECDFSTAWGLRDPGERGGVLPGEVVEASLYRRDRLRFKQGARRSVRAQDQPQRPRLLERIVLLSHGNDQRTRRSLVVGTRQSRPGVGTLGGQGRHEFNGLLFGVCTDGDATASVALRHRDVYEARSLDCIAVAHLRRPIRRKKLAVDVVRNQWSGMRPMNAPRPVAAVSSGSKNQAAMPLAPM